MRHRRIPERVLLAMPAYLRGYYKTMRTRPKASEDWYDCSLVADQDDHLDDVINEAECLAEVRGPEYVQRQVSNHLNEIERWAPAGSVELDWSAHSKTFDKERIALELAGINPDNKTKTKVALIE